MYATKEAIIGKEHAKNLEPTIFFMDIRAHGKDFDQYYERAKMQENIAYIKSMPSRIIQIPGTKDLRVQFYNQDRKFEEREFDLVVLSVGIEPGATVQESAKNLGPVVNSKYSDFAPFISADGNSLYFCSDREGGFGASVRCFFQGSPYA
jgi:heterodisulfide reductase subunit A-like polyferredoxin